MSKQLTFFEGFLEWYEENCFWIWDVNINDFKDFARESLSLFNLSFSALCENINFKDFQKIKIKFYKEDFEIDVHWFKQKIDKLVCYQNWGIFTIFLKETEMETIFQYFWTGSWFVFLIAHEFAHWIQEQLRYQWRKSCDIECHANFIAWYLLQILKKALKIEINISEILQSAENHGNIQDLHWVLGIKKKKTHFNWLESKRSIEEWYTTSLEEFLNTFPPLISDNIRPYKERPTNYTWPDFYEF